MRVVIRSTPTQEPKTEMLIRVALPQSREPEFQTMTGSIEAQNGKGELLAFGQIGKGMEPGWDLHKANKPLNSWLNLGKNAKGGYSCDGSI